MSISFISITKNADRSWTFTWSGSGTWRVVLYGVYIATVTTPSYRWPSDSVFTDYPPPLEVVVSTEKALSEQHKPYVLIQWYREEDTARYLIQKSDDGSTGWATVYTMPEMGLWVYTYHSPILDDGTTHHWRVVAESAIGTQSPAQDYNATIVTPPRPVDSEIVIEYSAGNVVVRGA
jgi:hypothetical protein